MAKTYNIFISHSWSNPDTYEKLKILLDKEHDFDYVDYSIPRDDAVHSASDRDLHIAIYNKMLPCHIVLIMAGVYSTYSKWITKEIQIAIREFSSPKPLLAVMPWDNTKVSLAVALNATKIVNWNTESIVDAIRNIAVIKRGYIN